MIRILKPRRAPNILTTDGISKRNQHCQDYQANPALYQTRSGKFSFDASIYADPTVKQALEAAHHNKCCYCEIYVGDVGEVEHFRPKAASQQAKGMKQNRPGYYWLAYEWDNLFLACHSCNTIKRYLFPLEDPSLRARDHNGNCANETPLFVHPTHDNPEKFISFNEEVPQALNARGRRTITSLRLDRPDLNDVRRTKLDLLLTSQDLIFIAQQTPGLVTQQKLRDAQDRVDNCTNDNAPFARMARANGF